MVTGDALAVGVVGAVAVERLVELRLSTRNATRALAAGAVESGRAHYGAMTAFHTAFLVACVAEPWLFDRPFRAGLAAVCVLALIGAQALRWWAITTLGTRWSTRVITWPDAAPVTGGPYAWLRHPNYVAVIVEMVALPLVHGAWVTGLLATVGNALLLRVRIAAEERALGSHWSRAFADTPRFVPGASRDA